MKTYTLDEMKRAFECGRNFQLTGENNFQELIEALSPALPIHSVVRGAVTSHCLSLKDECEFTNTCPECTKPATEPLPAEGVAQNGRGGKVVKFEDPIRKKILKQIIDTTKSF